MKRSTGRDVAGIPEPTLSIMTINFVTKAAAETGKRHRCQSQGIIGGKITKNGRNKMSV